MLALLPRTASARLVWYAVGLGLALRIAVACWNGLAGPSFGADADAAHYHSFAVSVARGEAWPVAPPPGFFFARVLGYVYRVTGASLLIGSLISSGVWLASAVVLLAAMRLLAVGPVHQLAGMTVYAVLPSSVLWTSVTMREPYQLLCVNLILLTGLKILLGGAGWYWVLLVLLAGVGASLHAAIFLLATLTCVGLLLVKLWRTPLRFAMKAVILAFLAAAFTLGGMAFMARVFPYDLSGGPSVAMARLAEGALWYSARTVYRDGLAVDPILFAPVWLFQYLFEPMPWRIAGLIDWGFAMENLVRAWLIGMMITGLWHSRGRERTQLLLACLSYLSLEAVWSLGTFNWGTAARHHIPATGLLLAGSLAFTGARVTLACESGRHGRSS